MDRTESSKLRLVEAAKHPNVARVKFYDVNFEVIPNGCHRSVKDVSLDGVVALTLGRGCGALQAFGLKPTIKFRDVNDLIDNQILFAIGNPPRLRPKDVVDAIQVLAKKPVSTEAWKAC